ncbi:MAG: hypothetical protein NT126_07335 [Bacteroidetes bacterium]|nr:hypothetical protein [Bacteroidota bacterium]
MKNFGPLTSLLFALFFISACSSTYHAGTSNSDDVYYSSKDANQNPGNKKTVSESPAPSDYSKENSNYSQEDQNNSGSNNQSNAQINSDYTNSTQEKDDRGHTYVTNNYYNDDDYYDYAYTARLKRFYAPAYGYSYYDPFYTNLYWYDYNPASWGVSIYLGYHWWAPSFYYNDPFCYGGIFSSYDPWYSPYCGYGMNYWNGYSMGYYSGYMNGYYHGLNGYSNPYYYNSYDATSYYYGPRNSAGSNSPGRSNPMSTGNGIRQPRTLGDKYVEAVHTGRINTIPKSESVEIKNVRPEDTKNNVSSPNDHHTGKGNTNEIPVRTDVKTPGETVPVKSVPTAPVNHHIENLPVNSGNENVKPSSPTVPAKGPITIKNETTLPDRDNRDNPVKENATPVFPEPVKGNTGRPSKDQMQNTPHNNPGNAVDPRPENRNNVNPKPNIIKPNSDSPMPRNQENTIQHENSHPRPIENISKPNPEINHPIEQPQNQNPPSPRQNNEPRKPRQMSNSESRPSSPAQMNRSFSENRSPSGNANGNSSSGRNNSNSVGRGKR